MTAYFDLTGKTALITGASRDLGYRFAKILSEYVSRPYIGLAPEYSLGFV